MAVPLIRPCPPRLSQAVDRLRQIEDSGLFSNFGPVNKGFEADLIGRMFAGEGACMTVCNATIGLMLAVRQVIGEPVAGRRYALMPAFTFAAAAQAAMWCGLTPLFCDIDPVTWTACPREEERLLAEYGDQIAVVMPYATFGYEIDLDRYDQMTRRTGIPVVVDAAASLGTNSGDGRGFGTGFSGMVVYSMHATKSFSTGEGGVVYSANTDAIAELRQMCNFGFGKPRNATMPGLNGKLSEIGALLAQLRLDESDPLLAHREALMRGYREALPELTYQPETAGRQAHQFAPGLLPPALAPHRAAIAESLGRQGIGSATYFSPHLMEQDYFVRHAVAGPLPVTDDIAGRIISLPLFDSMTRLDLIEVTTAMRHEIRLRTVPPQRPFRVPEKQAALAPTPTLSPSEIYASAAGTL